MRFELARLFLAPRQQLDMLERRNEDGTQMTRKEWLTAILGDRVDFEHRKGPCRYEPVSEHSSATRLVARMGRQWESLENDPNDHLREIKQPRWNASLLIIDPTEHEDGQKVAFQTTSAAKTSFGHLASLVASINARKPCEPYSIAVHRITEDRRFWEYVSENEGEIISITLEVEAPNMFGGESKFEEEMKNVRDRLNARRVKLTMSNPDGLDPNTQDLRDAVSYATRGGGKVKSRAMDGSRYDSDKDAMRYGVNLDAQQKKDEAEKITAAIKAFEEEAGAHETKSRTPGPDDDD